LWALGGEPYTAGRLDCARARVVWEAGQRRDATGGNTHIAGGHDAGIVGSVEPVECKACQGRPGAGGGGWEGGLVGAGDAGAAAVKE
jgi:hypothetical protein